MSVSGPTVTSDWSLQAIPTRPEGPVTSRSLADRAVPTATSAGALPWNKVAWPATSVTRQVRSGDDADPAVARLADLQDRIRLVEGRVARVREEVATIRRQRIDDQEIALALSVFDPVWESLSPGEQAHVVGLLVERVDYDGAKGKVQIAFHTAGIKTLADELAARGGKEKRA